MRKQLIGFSILLCALTIQSCSHHHQIVQKYNLRPIGVKALSAEDLKHGEKQVELMLNDRPRMKELVHTDDPVWTWTARQFAGEGTGTRIYWSNDSTGPPADYLAISQPPMKNSPGYIRIRDRDQFGAPVSAEDLWDRAIFELHNIRNGPVLAKILRRALAGRVSKEEWMRQTTMLEYKARKDTILFYKDVAYPTFHRANEKIHDQSSQLDNYKDYGTWISHYTDRNGYPWNYWGKYYDTTIAPYVLRPQFDKLSHLLQ
jgi:hypothetical protein